MGLDSWLKGEETSVDVECGEKEDHPEEMGD